MLKKIVRKWKSVHISYLKSRKLPLMESTFLLEAGQGKNINGNMFALAKELCTNPKWKDYEVYWVVTEDTRLDAQTRFDFYNYSVRLIERNSPAYCDILARAHYVLTDNSFPPFFQKRKEQVYVNTWHGTPLKTLGKSDIKNAKSLANIQKNYLMADYALFPNELTKNVFMKDYMLEHIYSGHILMCDYPRNSSLMDTERAKNIRTELQLEGKQLIAYMPTWRGSDRTADAQIQKEILENYFRQIDMRLQDHQIFYVNLHFLVGNTMDFSSYQHIRPFPANYETYDFLGICDMLVTDYSSVFFDFAVTNKKIILFAYDLEEYMQSRGTYFSVYDLPFPIVFTVKELIDQINQDTLPDMQDFLEEFCLYRDKEIPHKIIDLLVHGNTHDLVIEKREEKQDLVLVYVGDLHSVYLNTYLHMCIQHVIKRYSNHTVLVCFRGAIDEKKIEFLNTLPENVDYLAMVTKYNFSIFEWIRARLSLISSFANTAFHASLSSVYAMERDRFLPSIHPAVFVNCASKIQYIQSVLETFSCRKELYLHPEHFLGTMTGTTLYKNHIRNSKKVYDEIIDERNQDVHMFWNQTENIYYNTCFSIGNIWHRFKNTERTMEIKAWAILITSENIPLDQLHIQIADHEMPLQIQKIVSLSSRMQLVRYVITVPCDRIRDFEIQNKINFVYTDPKGYGLKKGIKYNVFHLRKGKNKQGPIRIFKESETSAYFRQSKNNVLYLTVRKQNLTDAPIEQLKLEIAYYVSKILPMSDKILLFEKEASRYEESASVLYEKLIDQGYKQVYFILNKKYPYRNQIQEKYRLNLIDKGSFKHYLYFFRAKTFLGSEALVHAIDLRISNKHALNKLNDKTLNYVFLQHGVMYMVSLDSESRRFFKPMKTQGKYRVVTSSVMEAKHFIELGGYDPEYIYVCGLPKFDRNTWNADADKIVIMPTWRPWEYNEARYDFKETKYYKMICRIFDAIPSKFKEKVIILPHPLFYDAIKDSDFELKSYLNIDSKYDDILKETKILITDYSSIAYDAFYRGCNVMFYWEEKDECMENYGPSTKLMLNEENVYGDVCYKAKDVTDLLEINYYEGQPKEFQEKYARLVDFHDGHNTERLIDLLKRDEIIQ